MMLVGDILRTERESQGRTVAEIADELCIMQRYVSAMECGDVKALPGLFFYKSFARQYAAILALDEQLILPQISALIAAEETAAARPDVRVLDPIVERSNRLHIPDGSLGWSVAGLAAVLLVCSAFYTWWNRVPAPQVSAQHVARVAAGQAAAVITIPAHVVGSPEPVVAVPTPVLAIRSDAMRSDAISGVISDVSVNSAESATASGVVLKLSATERTWLSIRSGGREIFSGFLLPSESKTLTGLDIATMKVGNAAGIDVRWNGKPIGPLGTRGQVLTIRFTPQDFEIVPPKQEL